MIVPTKDVSLGPWTYSIDEIDPPIEFHGIYRVSSIHSFHLSHSPTVFDKTKQMEKVGRHCKKKTT